MKFNYVNKQLPSCGVTERPTSTGTDLRTLGHTYAKFRLFCGRHNYIRIKPRSLVVFNRMMTAVLKICQQQ